MIRLPAKHFLHVSQHTFDSQSHEKLRRRAKCLRPVFYTKRVERLQNDPYKAESCSSTPVQVGHYNRMLDTAVPKNYWQEVLDKSQLRIIGSFTNAVPRRSVGCSTFDKKPKSLVFDTKSDLSNFRPLSVTVESGTPASETQS